MHRRLERLLLLVVASALGFHFLMTLVYLLPTSSPRLEYGAQADRYLFPLFGQTWALFAPNPPLADASLEYQCSRDGGEPTEWLNLHDELRNTHRSQRFTPATYLRRLERAAVLAAKGTRDSDLDHLLSKLEEGDEEFRAYVAKRVSAHTHRTAIQARFSYNLATEHCRRLGDVDAVRIRIVSSDIPKFSKRNSSEDDREWHSDPFPWVRADEIRKIGADATQFELTVDQLMSTREEQPNTRCGGKTREVQDD